MQVLSVLLLSLSAAQCSVIPVANSKPNRSLIKRAGPPKCPPSGGAKSQFFKTSVGYLDSYGGNADEAALEILQLPDDLSDSGNCVPRPNDTQNPELYPRPNAGSSVCRRRDQEVRKILYRNIVSISNPGLLSIASSQNPRDFPSAADMAAAKKYCSDNTATFAEVRDSLEYLRGEYFEMLDQVDRQTCLIELGPRSSTFLYIFNDPTANIDKDTSIRGVLHAFNTIVAAMKYNGETIGPRAQESINMILGRFEGTRNLMTTRDTCSTSVKNRCSAIGVPLDEQGLVTNIVNGVLGSNGECPAKVLTESSLLDIIL